MRQAGVIAACGLVSLRKMRHRLPEDRANAEQLAATFRDSGLFTVSPEPVKINMFFLRYREQDAPERQQRLTRELIRRGILVNPPEDGWIRIVTHHDVSAEDVQRARSLIEEAIEAVDA
jgi:threonine aldolase